MDNLMNKAIPFICAFIVFSISLGILGVMGVVKTPAYGISIVIAYIVQNFVKNMIVPKKNSPAKKAGQQTTVEFSISNYDLIKKYLNKDSFMQLVKLPENNKIEGQINKRYFNFDSDLDKVEFSDDNKFTFSIPNSDKNKYIIALQNLIPVSIFKKPDTPLPSDRTRIEIPLNDLTIKKEKLLTEIFPYYFLCDNGKLLIIENDKNSNSSFNLYFNESYFSSFE